MAARLLDGLGSFSKKARVRFMGPGAKFCGWVSRIRKTLEVRSRSLRLKRDGLQISYLRRSDSLPRTRESFPLKPPTKFPVGLSTGSLQLWSLPRLGVTGLAIHPTKV